jgi:thiamine transporter ThiT
LEKNYEWGILAGIVMGIASTVVWKTYLTPIVQSVKEYPVSHYVATVVVVSLLTQSANAKLLKKNTISHT